MSVWMAIFGLTAQTGTPEGRAVIPEEVVV